MATVSSPQLFVGVCSSSSSSGSRLHCSNRALPSTPLPRLEPGWPLQRIRIQQRQQRLAYHAYIILVDIEPSESAHNRDSSGSEVHADVDPVKKLVIDDNVKLGLLCHLKATFRKPTASMF